MMNRCSNIFALRRSDRVPEEFAQVSPPKTLNCADLEVFVSHKFRDI